MDTLEMLRKKFEKYKELMDESGDQQAWDTLFEGYPERQKKNMGPFIENKTLAEGFTKAIPFYEQFGMEMKIVDISNNKMDSVIEIQKICPFIQMAKEYGFKKPCRIICEMDVSATKAAFGMKGDILSNQAEGDCVLIFKYERPRKK